MKENGKLLDVEAVVMDRYAKGALKKQALLCCAPKYNPRFLAVIPKEILEKDYGCGDPTPYLRYGDVVLDLGSGAGKTCFIASQIVGPKGKVIGVDFNPAMLTLARKYQKKIGDSIGWHNVEFKWGKIQDLKTDLEALERKLSRKPIRSVGDYVHLEEISAQMRSKTPLVRDESIDVVTSNCVLNLVRPEDKRTLFREIQRVLKKGGRVAISDIVSDEEVPLELQRDPDLWSGCTSGAFQEKAFLQAFEEAGFYGIAIEKRDEKPWRTVRGIEFRSVTLTAYKGKEGACWERNQAVIYKGPWKQVEDDDRHILRRGVRIAVCDKTFQIFSKAPYREQLIFIEPNKPIPLTKAKPFSATNRGGSATQFGGDCARNVERHPRETKGLRYARTTEPAAVCLDGGCC